MMLTANNQEPTATEQVDLTELVEHRESVPATETVENVYTWFKQHSQEYIGVLEGRRLAGLVSRGQIGFSPGGALRFCHLRAAAHRGEYDGPTAAAAGDHPVADGVGGGAVALGRLLL
jgi:hypothetical protein